MVRTIEMLKKYKDTSDEEFLTDEAFKRYKGVAMSISFPIKNFNVFVTNTDVIESNENLEALEQGLLIQSWSSLGSLLESSLQMFLAFYYDDFIKSNWSMWDKKAIEDIQSLIDDLNVDLKDKVENNLKSKDGGLNGKIRKSFLKKVKEIIKRKSRVPKLDNLTLSELIDFYFSKELISNKSDFKKEELQKIRDYRNTIHSFKDRSIGSWEELNEYSKLILLLVIEMAGQLPYISDDIPAEAAIKSSYLEEQAKLTMQENKWFDLKISISK